VLTDADVEDVQLSRTEQGAFISVRVTREAGERLLEVTSANKGRILVATWDDKTILSAPIQGPFAQTFQFTAPSSDQEARVLLNALRTGRLPVAVRSFEYHLR
jgi:preprotein translocase subunit SecD